MGVDKDTPVLYTCKAKLIEEMAELQQLLGKLVAYPDGNHPQGDLKPKLIEEMGDVYAALHFFNLNNFTPEEAQKIGERERMKLELYRQWHRLGEGMI